ARPGRAPHPQAPRRLDWQNGLPLPHRRGSDRSRDREGAGSLKKPFFISPSPSTIGTPAAPRPPPADPPRPPSPAFFAPSSSIPRNSSPAQHFSRSRAEFSPIPPVNA